MFRFFGNGGAEERDVEEEGGEEEREESIESTDEESHTEEKRKEDENKNDASTTKPRVSTRLPTLPALPDNYPLHAAVIAKDANALLEAIKKLPVCADPLIPFRNQPINALDHHGYTALTLCVLTSWKEGVQILLDHGASPGVTSSEGWSSINEAVSTSQREILKMLFVANMKLVKQTLSLRAPRVRKQLAQVQKKIFMWKSIGSLHHGFHLYHVFVQATLFEFGRKDVTCALIFH
ncbi:hypothetical protein RFI_13088 [Reticulomyxa filosa]|uniref:Uncharacterized protein n=1 Tax=Reticulomyxa filosa TaxID=46433 RepID=X6NDV1_RETFI|nr:hypothetical protein RFI_13088 [Reticulomyxa filosa]|eukprot:ETO24073.1 hypothetical protein RFI_13088 [Reticulomyxa filosa]